MERAPLSHQDPPLQKIIPPGTESESKKSTNADKEKSPLTAQISKGESPISITDTRNSRISVDLQRRLDMKSNSEPIVKAKLIRGDHLIENHVPI